MKRAEIRKVWAGQREKKAVGSHLQRKRPVEESSCQIAEPAILGAKIKRETTRIVTSLIREGGNWSIGNPKWSTENMVPRERSEDHRSHIQRTGNWSMCRKLCGRPGKEEAPAEGEGKKARDDTKGIK